MTEYVNKDYYNQIKGNCSYIDLNGQNIHSVMDRLRAEGIMFSATYGGYRNTVTVSKADTQRAFAIAAEYKKTAPAQNTQSRQRIIGNIEYSKIKDRNFINTDPATALQVANLLSGDASIRFSGRILEKSATITVSGRKNAEMVNRMIDNIRNADIINELYKAGYERLADTNGFVNIRNTNTGEVVGFRSMDMVREMFGDMNNEFFHPSAYRVDIIPEAVDPYYISEVDSITADEMNVYVDETVSAPVFDSRENAEQYAQDNHLVLTDFEEIISDVPPEHQDITDMPLVEQLSERVSEEYKFFISKMRNENPNVIIGSAYEISTKEIICKYIENEEVELSKEQFKALLSSKNLLDELYLEWNKNEYANGYDDVPMILQERADRIILSQQRVNVPVEHFEPETPKDEIAEALNLAENNLTFSVVTINNELVFAVGEYIERDDIHGLEEYQDYISKNQFDEVRAYVEYCMIGNSEIESEMAYTDDIDFINANLKAVMNHSQTTNLEINNYLIATPDEMLESRQQKILLEKAKEYIDDFLDKEYGDEPSEDTYKDMRNVPLGYTTLGDDADHDFSVSANLVDFSVSYTLDGEIVKTETYDSLEEMNNKALVWLDFGDMTVVGNEALEETENKKFHLVVPEMNVDADMREIDSITIQTPDDVLMFYYSTNNNTIERAWQSDDNSDTAVNIDEVITDIRNALSNAFAVDVFYTAEERQTVENKSTETPEKRNLFNNLNYDFNRVFKGFIESMEFSVVKVGDEYSLRDNANLGDIHSDKFDNAVAMTDRLDMYITDYYIRDIAEQLDGIVSGDMDSVEGIIEAINAHSDDNRVTAFFNENIADMQVLDLIVNHIDDVDLNIAFADAEIEISEELTAIDDETAVIMWEQGLVVYHNGTPIPPMEENRDNEHSVFSNLSDDFYADKEDVKAFRIADDIASEIWELNKVFSNVPREAGQPYYLSLEFGDYDEWEGYSKGLNEYQNTLKALYTGNYEAVETYLDNIRSSDDVSVELQEQAESLLDAVKVFRNLSGIEKEAEKDIELTYTIYQIKKGEDFHNIRFTRWSDMPKLNLDFDRNNYDEIYSGKLADVSRFPFRDGILEDIFKKFNLDRPEDFTGHSLSVSDVVVLETAEGNSAHFVDSFGMVNVTDLFFDVEKQRIELSKLTAVTIVEEYDRRGDEPDNSTHIKNTIIFTELNKLDAVSRFKDFTYDYDVMPDLDEGYTTVSSQEMLDEINDYFEKSRSDSSISISVTDVEGKETRLDSMLYDFTLGEKDVPVEHLEKNLAFEIPDKGYVAIFERDDEGYDYTFYDKGLNEIDGGIYDDDSISIREALAIVCEDNGIDLDNCKQVDYDTLIDWTELKTRDIAVGDRYLLNGEEIKVVAFPGIMSDFMGEAEVENNSQERYSVTVDELRKNGKFLGNDAPDRNTTVKSASEIVDEYIEEQEEKELEKAKEYISEYVGNIYGENEYFSNMKNISVDHFSVGRSEEHLFNMTADLENFSIRYMIDGNTVQKEQYGSVEEMNEKALSQLDYTANTALASRLCEEYEREQNKELDKLPVYTKSIEEAKELGERDKYFANMKENKKCEDAIVTAIADNYRNSSLDTDGAISDVLKEFVFERVELVVAARLSNLSFDGRIDKANIEWANGVLSHLSESERKRLSADTHFNSHPGLINLFANRVRSEERVRSQEEQVTEKKSEPYEPKLGDMFRDNSGEVWELTSLTGALPWYTDQCAITSSSGNVSITKNEYYSNLLDSSKYERIPDEPEQVQTAETTVKEEYSPAIGDVIELEGQVYSVADISGEVISLADTGTLFGDTRIMTLSDFYASNYEVVNGNKKNDAIANVPVEHQKPKAENFVITDENLGIKTPKARFAANVEAIRTLNTIEAENRTATPKEQTILSGYTGWGAIPNAFDSTNKDWSNEYAELKELLTDAEYIDARRSTMNAHFTSPVIINAIYQGLSNLGFEQGKILEPAMGIGNFFGAMPEAMRGSELYGVELDSLTGRIAKQLYPEADIQIKGFEKTKFENDSFDAVVGNVPFGDYKLSDKEYDKHKFYIHDYFVAKSIDKVRSGGVLAVVTSKGTMDKENPEMRKYIAQRAELLGAIRLPNDAFKKNAGTEVTSDILFFQKRERAIEINPDEIEWIGKSETAEGFRVNSYFANHPEMVLGTITEANQKYGPTENTQVVPIEGADLKQQLAEAVKNIQGTYIPRVKTAEKKKETGDTIPAPANSRVFSYYAVNGSVYFRDDSDTMTKAKITGETLKRALAMIEIRDTVRELLNMQLENADHSYDADIADSRAKLNEMYDAFVEKYGHFDDKKNIRAFKGDDGYNFLIALESVNKETGEYEKADIFRHDTVKPNNVVTHVETAEEALILSVAEKARVDFEYMTELSGMSKETLISELEGQIYRLPQEEEKYVTADEYLTGNIRSKIHQLEFAPDDMDVSKHREALESAMPKRVEAKDISVKLGAHWVAPEFVSQFISQKFNPSWRSRVEAHYSRASGKWKIEGASASDKTSYTATHDFGTKRKNAYAILEGILNHEDMTIKDPKLDEHGEPIRDSRDNIVKVTNHEETKAVQLMVKKIESEWADWIFKDPERREKLVEKYNEVFNSIRHREYDGSHLNFVGMNSEITLKEHQKNAVARALYGGNTLLAHCVGAGKSATRS